MRGRFHEQAGLFSCISPEMRVPLEHPLRSIRGVVRDILTEMSHSFGCGYASERLPSKPPEQLLSALLLQCSTASARSTS